MYWIGVTKGCIVQPIGCRQRGAEERRTRWTLSPGHCGAKHLLARYGAQLIGVRYWYAEQLQKRCKTAERMKNCRDCSNEVSEQAISCPKCGCPYPSREKWDGWGYEYKSETRLFGLPLLHISFKYRPNRLPVPAVGIISIGQFGAGLINISQFGVGVFSLSQFTICVFGIAQFAIAYQCIAQIAFVIDSGYGQIIKPIFR